MITKKWLIWLFFGLGVLTILAIMLIFSLTKEPRTSPQSIQDETAIEDEITFDNDMQMAMDAFSVDHMLDFLSQLTAINAHSGWRGGGTMGEKQAFDLVEKELAQLDWLITQGMTVERENFNVFVSTQDHLSKVELTVDGKTLEVPADTPRGNRDDLTLAAQMDSDGGITDEEPNPVQVEGKVVWIPDVEVLVNLQGSDLSNKVALVNYLLVDSSLRLAISARQAVQMIVDLNPKAVILYTEFSNINGESHGTFIGDGAGAFQVSEWHGSMPILFIQVEDLRDLGITNSEQLKTVNYAKVAWDVDVINPGTSSNLIVHIPGKNAGHPVLLSAHLDSANSPGALDDGSGSAILMEIAYVLNEEEIQPESDIYLVWFGSEELVLYGSGYFTTTHSELMNQLQANIQVDCLLQPLEGLPSSITLEFGYYGTPRLEDDSLAKYMKSQADNLGIALDMLYEPFPSDNGSFSAFNVPNINMIYMDESMFEIEGGPWYAGHMHSPYDTVDRVVEVMDVFEKMGKLTLSMAFIPTDEQKFYQKEYSKKALFIATHTEAPTMTPTGLPVFSQNLIDAGYEIRTLPFGQTFELSDLAEFDLVVALPPYDFAAEEPSRMSDDVVWTEQEAEAVDAYAQSGGTVLVMNSGHRLKLYSRLVETNEDWAELNTLVGQWGVQFIQTRPGVDSMPTNLNGDDFSVNLNQENAVFFTAPEESVRAGTTRSAAIAELVIGEGRVIVLADLGMLGETYEGITNPQLMKNLLELIAE